MIRIHSFIHLVIFMIGTYVSLFKCLTGSRTLSIALVYGPLTQAIATLAELA